MAAPRARGDVTCLVERKHSMRSSWDVIVVGSGNAAFSAAHAAREQAQHVLMLEKAPRQWAGGNSYFTAGAFRTTYESLDELRPLLADLSDERAAEIDLPAYTTADFTADMDRVTEGRCDRELAAVLVAEAAATTRWLHDKGVRWRLLYERQAYRVDGRYRFWGGLALGVVGGGPGLLEQHGAAASASGIEMRYESPVVALLQDAGGAVTGVACHGPNGREELTAGAVVLACGGFEADPHLRATYLGPNWDVAKVRGTAFNTGEGLHMALAAGAQAFGHWSGCHAVPWDAAAPATGDRGLTNRLSRLSYPLGLIVNAEARRFVDEGADFRNYTYAKYGAAILRQPGAVAYQLFDARTEPLLRADEYRAPVASRVEAATVGELAGKLGLDAGALECTVNTFNAAVRPGAFNPAVKDGVRTIGLEPPKSNWALPLEAPPYYGFAVTCGITFTFGGLRVDTHGRVLNGAGRPLAGLHAAGELVGGLFYHNYPGGSGLMAGSVFGRRAGRAAADYARARST